MRYHRAGCADGALPVATKEYLTPDPVPLLTPRPVSSVTATVPKTSPSSERQ